MLNGPHINDVEMNKNLVSQVTFFFFCLMYLAFTHKKKNLGGEIALSYEARLWGLSWGAFRVSLEQPGRVVPPKTVYVEKVIYLI